MFVIVKERKFNKIGRLYATNKLAVEKAKLVTLFFEKDYPEAGKVNWHGTAIVMRPDVSYDVPASGFNAFFEKEKAEEMKAAMESDGYTVMAGNGDYIMLKSTWERCRTV